MTPTPRPFTSQVSYNGLPIWSKIDSGRFPNIVELKDALGNVAFEPH